MGARTMVRLDERLLPGSHRAAAACDGLDFPIAGKARRPELAAAAAARLKLVDGKARVRRPPDIAAGVEEVRSYERATRRAPGRRRGSLFGPSADDGFAACPVAGFSLPIQFYC